MPKGGTAGGGKAKVGFTKPPDPSFIREMKEQVGYREPDVLGDKTRRDEGEPAEDREDREDEAPTVVVLGKHDLSEEQVIAEKAAAEVDEDAPPADGKIRFKKPEKAKKRTGEEEKIDHTGERNKKVKKLNKVQKNMLSFNEDEEDE